MTHDFQKGNPRRNKEIYKLREQGVSFQKIADMMSLKYSKKISWQRVQQLYGKYVKKLKENWGIDK